MSTQDPFFHSEAVAGEHVAQGASGPAAGDDVDGLRAQVLEIIDDVLAEESSPAVVVREQLRQRVAAHPGRPERALREHLAALRPELAGTIRPGSSKGQGALTVGSGGQRSQAGGRVRGSGQRVGRSRLEAVLRGRMLVTAFQPIYDLPTGSVIGAEALTRFVSDGADAAVDWFAAAEVTGLGLDLEFAALESALMAARDLPPGLFVALKLSLAACVDDRLPALIGEMPLAPDRLVLELSGSCDADQAGLLETAVAPLRRAGVRVSIDHVGSYFASVCHLLRLRPEMIKLDPGLTAGIDQDSVRQELVAAELGFARRIGATLGAQRIETRAELDILTGLGITIGQGYHLGRPTVQPSEWASWRELAGSLASPSRQGSVVRS